MSLEHWPRPFEGLEAVKSAGLSDMHHCKGMSSQCPWPMQEEDLPWPSAECWLQRWSSQMQQIDPGWKLQYALQQVGPVLQCCTPTIPRSGNSQTPAPSSPESVACKSTPQSSSQCKKGACQSSRDHSLEPVHLWDLPYLHGTEDDIWGHHRHAGVQSWRMVTNKWYSCKPISIFLASSKHWCHSWSSSKRPCAMQASLKKTEVEPFSRCGMSMIHPTYSRDSLLPGGPLVCLLVPNHLGGKILIEKIAIICQLSICLNPCS